MSTLTRQQKVIGTLQCSIRDGNNLFDNMNKCAAASNFPILAPPTGR
jgi:hypothetical protein